MVFGGGGGVHTNSALHLYIAQAGSTMMVFSVAS